MAVTAVFRMNEARLLWHGAGGAAIAHVGVAAFDPFPFLNLMLSMLAALQVGAMVDEGEVAEGRALGTMGGRGRANSHRAHPIPQVWTGRFFKK